MTQETPEWLDYSKPPRGWSPVVACGFEDGTFFTSAQNNLMGRSDVIAAVYRGETPADVISASWSHYKRSNDPPGIGASVSVKAKAIRAAGWAWHDRRSALVVSLFSQFCEFNLAALLSKILPWTDAECEAVEAYAALPFPRSVDMPQALQRALLPGAT